MKINIYDMNDKFIDTANFNSEVESIAGYHGVEDYYTVESYSCKGKGCESHDTEERYDAYNISTGYYCDSCYESNYPYRKDRYETVEYHGFGERLDDY